MSYAFQRPNKRVKMLHRSTPYDYVVRSMLNISGDVPEKECRNVLEGEILMTDPKGRGAYLSSHAHVHSDQRAFGKSKSHVNLLDNLQVAGFAVTGFNEGTSQYAQGFMSTVGGVNTVMNTGVSQIAAGKLIYALPRKTTSKTPHIRGVHTSKVLFALSDEDGQDYKDALDVKGGDASKLDKFCVGTALCSSRSGQTVDVLLHSRVSNS